MIEKSEKRKLNIRHRCFYFSREVLLFVKNSEFDALYRSVFVQLIRSATSIGANMVEARAGSTKKDWINFIVIGLKSANETKYWLCLIRDSLPVNREWVERLIKEADEISRIIARIIINASKK